MSHAPTRGVPYWLTLGLAGAMTAALLEAAIGGVLDHSVHWRQVFSGMASVGTLGVGCALLGLLLVRLMRLGTQRSARLSRWVNSAREGIAAVSATRLAAELTAGILAVSLASLAYRFPLRLSEDMTAESSKLRVLVVGAGATAALALVVHRALVPLAQKLFQRVKLPARYANWPSFSSLILAPAALTLLLATRVAGEELGVLVLAVGSLAAAAVARQIHLVLTWASERIPTAAKVRKWSLPILCWPTFVIGLWMLSTDARSAPKGHVAAASVQLLQSLTDVDRDGMSSAFGGLDCAPFDPKRYPGAREVPKNGTDEDCNGEDLELEPKQKRQATFSDPVRAIEPQRFNVVLVVVDSLRADHTTPYGYRHDTTPYFNALAAEAWLFEHAYSQATNTSMSMPSLTSGLDPGSIEWQQGRNYPEPKQPHQSLQGTLSAAGYYTAITLNQRMNARIPAAKADYQDVLVTPKGQDWNSGEYSVANAAKAISKATRSKRNFMLTVHVDGVHSPYIGGRGHALPKFKIEDAKMADYDRGITEFDHTLAGLVALLKTEGVWEQTVLIVTADHGEEFGEHGERNHSTSCHRETSQVPLLVRIPEREAQRISSPVALVDVVPTVLDLVGMRDKLQSLDGQSLLVPGLNPDRVDPERPIFCTVYQLFSRKKDFCWRSVRAGKFALMYEFLNDRTQLFDVTKDPEEHDDLSKDPERVETTRKLLALVKSSKKSNVLESRRLKK